MRTLLALVLAQVVSLPCVGEWKSDSIYVGGDTASVGGHNYRANWWVQGQSPVSNNGGPASGQPWTDMGGCQTGAVSVPVSVPVVSTPVSTPVLPPVKFNGSVLSPYKDVAISANWNTSVISTNVTGSLTPLLQAVPTLPAVTWAFATGECGSETWGGISGPILAGANVSSFVSAKMPYIISTGGAAGAFTCGSDAGFAVFLDRYMSPYLLGLDFDIEAGQSQVTIDALIARVKSAQTNPKYAGLRFSFTLATLGGNSAQSLGDAGVKVMASIKGAGLQNYIVNLMAMDYGSASATNCVVVDGQCEMGLSANQAAINLHTFYGVPYSQIELTPMIGGNDTQGETFTLADVDTVVAFANKNGLAGLHFWSLDRDVDCKPGYASPVCNSYGQAGTLGFTKRFVLGSKT